DDEEQITNVDFKGITFNRFYEVIGRLVHGVLYRLYYYKVGMSLRLGLKELKTNEDVHGFMRLTYESKWAIDLYDEHFHYDVLHFVDASRNDIQIENSDEYSFSDKQEQIEFVDFHSVGEENVITKNITTQDPF
ncbi:hypothetical protein Tco_1181343, partial [Tanacetum coccineum]